MRQRGPISEYYKDTKIKMEDTLDLSLKIHNMRLHHIRKTCDKGLATTCDSPYSLLIMLKLTVAYALLSQREVRTNILLA